MNKRGESITVDGNVIEILSDETDMIIKQLERDSRRRNVSLTDRIYGRYERELVDASKEGIDIGNYSFTGSKFFRSLSRQAQSTMIGLLKTGIISVYYGFYKNKPGKPVTYVVQSNN